MALVVRRTRTRYCLRDFARTRPMRPSGRRTQSPMRHALAIVSLGGQSLLKVADGRPERRRPRSSRPLRAFHCACFSGRHAARARYPAAMAVCSSAKQRRCVSGDPRRSVPATHDEHRARGRPYHPIGDAAHQQPSHASAPAGAHDHEIYAVILGGPRARTTARGDQYSPGFFSAYSVGSLIRLCAS